MPGIDLDAYKHQLIERFSNAAVRDTVARLCAESSDRIPKWLLPVIRENLAAGREVRLVGGRGGQLGPVRRGRRRAGRADHRRRPAGRLADRDRADRSASDPLAFVANRELFGDLVDATGFTEPYLAALDCLHTRGARATLESLVGSSVR